jgi:hypothetical protein
MLFALTIYWNKRLWLSSIAGYFWTRVPSPICMYKQQNLILKNINAWFWIEYPTGPAISLLTNSSEKNIKLVIFPPNIWINVSAHLLYGNFLLNNLSYQITLSYLYSFLSRQLPHPQKADTNICDFLIGPTPQRQLSKRLWWKCSWDCIRQMQSYDHAKNTRRAR